jgi:hypothetical protein
MSSHHPLRANSLHPEYFAAPAAEADKLGRFCVVISGKAERPAAVWSRYGKGPARRGDHPITATAFSPAFRILLAAVRECRLFGVTPKSRRDNPGAPEAWLERYAIRDGHHHDVDTSAAGVLDDLEPWWWLVRHAEPVLICDANSLDAPTLFSIGSGPMFNGPDRKRASEAHARKRAGQRGAVSLRPYGSEDCWGLIVMAAPGLAGDLAREAVLRQPLSEEVRTVRATLKTDCLSSIEAIEYWYYSKVKARSFEKTLVATLEEGEKKPRDADVAFRALLAAEGVAIAEGRGPPDGTADVEVIEVIEEIVKEADPLGDATLELALRAVQTVSAAGECERARWVGEEARSSFRAELEGLEKRLAAAVRTRRARAHAPNSVPPVLPTTPGAPVNWRTRWLHLMLDDAVALIGAARKEIGAVPLILMEDHSFRELATDWDALEALSTIRGQPFEERDGGWLDLNSGQKVLLWWPGISPRPFISEERDGPTIVSWGHAELGLFGATRTHVLRSTWSYPTGTELKRRRFAGAGPWRDVNWPAFRQKIKAIKKLLVGTLGGVAPVDLRDTVTLPVAAATARSGKRAIIGQGVHSKATLPE